MANTTIPTKAHNAPDKELEYMIYRISTITFTTDKAFSNFFVFFTNKIYSDITKEILATKAP